MKWLKLNRPSWYRLRIIRVRRKQPTCCAHLDEALQQVKENKTVPLPLLRTYEHPV